MSFNPYASDNNKLIIERLAEVQKLLASLDLDNFEIIFSIISKSIFMRKAYFPRFYIILKKTVLSYYSKIELYVSLLMKLVPYFMVDNMNNPFFLDSDPLLANLLAPSNNRLFKPDDIIYAFNNNLLHATDENLIYFLPELGESILLSIQNTQLLEICKPFLEDFRKGNFIEFRCLGINQDPLAQIIREDRSDEFEVLLLNGGITPETPIKYSIYERGYLVSDYIFRPTPILYAAYYGSYKIFHQLYPSYVGSENLLMSYALMGNNKKIIETILSNNFKYDKRFFEDSILYLKNEYLEDGILDRDMITNSEIFIESIHSLNIDLINKYYNTTDINYINGSGENLLQAYARGNECPTESLFLFECFPNFDYFHKDNKGRTIIHDGIAKFDTLLSDGLRYLPKYDPNIPDNDEITPLILSVSNRCSVFVRFFMQNYEIRPNYYGKSGSALSTALEKYDSGCFAELVYKRVDDIVERNVDLSKLSPNCVNPIEFAIESDNKESFSFMMANWSPEFNKVFSSVGKPLLHFLIDQYRGDLFYISTAINCRSVNVYKRDKNKILFLYF